MRKKKKVSCDLERLSLSYGTDGKMDGKRLTWKWKQKVIKNNEIKKRLICEVLCFNGAEYMSEKQLGYKTHFCWDWFICPSELMPNYAYYPPYIMYALWPKIYSLTFSFFTLSWPDIKYYNSPPILQSFVKHMAGKSLKRFSIDPNAI